MAKSDNRLEQLRNKRNNKPKGEPADWSGVDAKLLLNAIAWTAACGGALRLGYTRDGGAYAIGIYLGADSTTEYVRPNEDIEEYLTGLALDMEDTYRTSK